MTKFSGIPNNNSPAVGDSAVGVTSGNVDNRFTLQNLIALFFANIPANTIKTPALALSAALDAVNGMKTDTNPGSAGGSRNYINLGGIKLCWGTTASIGISGASQAVAVVTFPVGFFTGGPSASLGGTPSGTIALQAHLNTTPSTTNMTLAVDSTSGGAATGGMIINWFAIGI